MMERLTIKYDGVYVSVSDSEVGDVFLYGRHAGAPPEICIPSRGWFHAGIGRGSSGPMCIGLKLW